MPLMLLNPTNPYIAEGSRLTRQQLPGYLEDLKHDRQLADSQSDFDKTMRAEIDEAIKYFTAPHALKPNPIDPGIAGRPFEAPAPRSDWHNDVSLAVQELKGEPLSAAARVYVEAAPDAYRQYGDEGLRVQLFYIISNLRATTPNLKRLKKELQALAKQAPNPGQPRPFEAPSASLRAGNPSSRRMPPSANWRVNFMNQFVKEFGHSPADHEIQWAFDLYQRGFSVRSAVTRMMKRVGWKAERQPNIAIRRTPGPRTRAGKVTLYPPNPNSVIATGTTDTGKNMIPFMFVELYATKGRLGLIAFGAYNAMGLIGPEKGGVALVDEKLHQVLGTHDVPYSRRGREQLFRQVYESANWFAAATALGFGMRFDRQPNPGIPTVSYRHGFASGQVDTRGRQLPWKKLRAHPEIEVAAVRVPAYLRRRGEPAVVNYYRLAFMPALGTMAQGPKGLRSLLQNLPSLRKMWKQHNPGAKWHREKMSEAQRHRMAAQYRGDEVVANYYMGHQDANSLALTESLRQPNPGAKWHRQEAGELRKIAAELPVDDHAAALDMVYQAERHELDAEQGYTGKWWHGRMARSEMQSALKYPTGKAHQMSRAGFVASRHSEEESEHYMEPGWDERAAKRRARKDNPTPAQGFQTFHQAAPDRTRRVKVPKGWPTRLWMLGSLKLLILQSGKRIHGGTVCAATGNRIYIVNANYTGRLSPGERATQIEYVTPSVSERAGPVWFHPFDSPPPVRETAHGFLTLAGKGIKLTRRGIVG